MLAHRSKSRACNITYIRNILKSAEHAAVANIRMKCGQREDDQKVSRIIFIFFFIISFK